MGPVREFISWRLSLRRNYAWASFLPPPTPPRPSRGPTAAAPAPARRRRGDGVCERNNGFDEFLALSHRRRDAPRRVVSERLRAGGALRNNHGVGGVRRACGEPRRRGGVTRRSRRRGGPVRTHLAVAEGWTYGKSTRGRVSRAPRTACTQRDACPDAWGRRPAAASGPRPAGWSRLRAGRRLC